MSWDPIVDKNYILYDAPFGKPAKRELQQFEYLTGGDMTISMVSYNVMDPNGNVTTKFIPGQTSFAPINLSRPMGSISADLYTWFTDAVAGKLKDVRTNCSIALFDPSNSNKLRVIWDLENVIPTKIPGFSFSTITRTHSSSFKLVIQAENIVVTFPSP